MMQGFLATSCGSWLGASETQYVVLSAGNSATKYPSPVEITSDKSDLNPQRRPARWKGDCSAGRVKKNT